MRPAITEAPHTIVICRALQLGDLLCAVPAFRALRRAFPQAEISLVGLPWARAFVARFRQYLDTFIEFPGWPGLPESQAQAGAIPAFLTQMQARRFDLALQMQGAGTITNPMIALWGAKQTAGYYLPGQYRPNEDLFWVYPEGEPEIRIFLRLMGCLGIPSQSEALEFPVTDAERAAFARFETDHGLAGQAYACLHPGARFAGRRWEPEKFAAVGDGLAGLGLRVVLTGSASEQPLTQAVAHAMRRPALDAAGQTDLGTLALLLAQARLLVSNDTGVSHVAAAMQTPSVVLFNVSDPDRWRPLDHRRHRVITNANQAAPARVLAEAADLLQAAPDGLNPARTAVKGGRP